MDFILYLKYSNEKTYSISIKKVIAAFYLFVFWFQSSDGKTYIYRDKGFLILIPGEKKSSIRQKSTKSLYKK